ncbi:unnamed protein product [Meloidogyne enterolobii]|uniref:Uncharacterized protein n=1 Tax=Meloidogyne enterolobii TaxID=390850 RepID=A0ACB0YFA1_MELEN
MPCFVCVYFEASLGLQTAINAALLTSKLWCFMHSIINNEQWIKQTPLLVSKPEYFHNKYSSCSPLYGR